jgi:hypothetical protein
MPQQRTGRNPLPQAHRRCSTITGTALIRRFFG